MQVAAAGDVGRGGHPVTHLRGSAERPDGRARLLPAAPAVAQAVEALRAPRVHGGPSRAAARPAASRHFRQLQASPTPPKPSEGRTIREEAGPAAGCPNGTLLPAGPGFPRRAEQRWRPLSHRRSNVEDGEVAGRREGGAGVGVGARPVLCDPRVTDSA